MKICKSCGSNNVDEATFCASCGKDLVGENKQDQVNNSVSAQQNGKINVNSSKNGVFVSDDEYVVSTLSGKNLETEDVVLTNKRLYYNYTVSSILSRRSQNEIVNVEDITGSKIANTNPVVALVIAVLALVVGVFMAIANEDVEMLCIFCLPIAIIFSLIYLFLRRAHLKIEYAGGSISFLVKKYKKEKIKAFQKSIYIVKDSIDANNK